MFQSPIDVLSPFLLFKLEGAAFSKTGLMFLLLLFVFKNVSALCLEIKISILVYEALCGLENLFLKSKGFV